MPLTTKLAIANKILELATDVVADKSDNYVPIDGPYRYPDRMREIQYGKVVALRGRAGETKDAALKRLLGTFNFSEDLVALTIVMPLHFRQKAILRLLGLLMSMSFDLDTRVISRDAIRRTIHAIQDLLAALRDPQTLKAAIDYWEWLKTQRDRSDLPPTEIKKIDKELKKDPRQVFYWAVNYGSVALVALAFNLDDSNLMDVAFEDALDAASRASYAKSGEWANVRQIINELMDAGSTRGLIYSRRAADLARVKPSENLDLGCLKNFPDIDHNWWQIAPDVMERTGREREHEPRPPRASSLRSLAIATLVAWVGWIASGTGFERSRSGVAGNESPSVPFAGSITWFAGNVSDGRSLDDGEDLLLAGNVSDGRSLDDGKSSFLAGTVSDGRSLNGGESWLLAGNVSDG